jgi:hypothetical protein
MALRAIMRTPFGVRGYDIGRALRSRRDRSPQGSVRVGAMARSAM